MEHQEIGTYRNASPEELQARLAAIVASSDDAIVSKNLDGIVESWNDAAERIFGFTAEEMVGQPITKIIPDDRLEEEPNILERLRRGERIDHFQTVRRRKDGRLIDISVTISPIRGPSGHVIGASKIARDMSAYKRVLEERQQLLESEQAARREAERVSRAKDEFLATLSHELRTPLNAILGWAQLLRNGNSSPEDTEMGLETIERNARVQTQLIEELLDMSRIISGKLRLDVQRVDLPAVLNDSAESFRPATEAKGVKLYKVIDPKAGPVTGDPSRLQQVIWNLVSNAVKFTPRGGHIHIYLHRVNSHVEIVVTDTGQGIDAQFLPHVFSRFSQADASSTRHHGGLGLGLAIVKHLVELHGGTVAATSAGLGEGATFTVRLPLAPLIDARTRDDDRGEPRSVDASGSPLFAIDLSHVKVLVVDDEPDARALIRRLLEANKAKVVTAASADEAMAALAKERPNLLLTDIGMPGTDGYQLLQRVRALSPEEGGTVPAVALTAFARSEDRRRALLAGFQLHVAKPVEPAELLAVVANVARRGRA